MQPLAVPAGYVLLTLVLFTPAPARAQSPAAAAVPPTALASVTDAPPFDQAMALAELRKAIVGKEDLPSVEVFKNITQYKGVTAGRLLRIMDYGFTRSLGVDCTHCHVPGQWDRDDKAPKQIARAMSQMMAVINNDHLKKMSGLNSANPSVNCTTCHRGQKRPALESPLAPGTSPALPR